MGQAQAKIKYYDGSMYVGEVNSKNQEHGKGTINYANKNVLEGHFHNGSCYEA